MKLVIFDCDGTLVDSQHGIVASMIDAFGAEGLVAPAREKILGVVGLSLEIAVARLVPAGSDLERVDRMTDAYKAAFGARRRRADHAEPLYEGMRELVETLASRDDVRLGIATGKSRRGLDAVLERQGLTRHFATLQTADTNPSKPHPGMIEVAMQDAAVEPENTVMIGDTTFDIEMAIAADVAPIGVAWGYHPAEELWAAGARAVAAHHRELASALDRFLTPNSV